MTAGLDVVALRPTADGHAVVAEGVHGRLREIPTAWPAER
ncbi:MAG: hypothetical protein JWQ99_2445 [Blastococcus sp.]|nr:hypothetical protein [Blastococcus sp.]